MTVLSALIRHHLYDIPFENLDLHYSLSKHVCLDPDYIFDKVVGSGRIFDKVVGSGHGQRGRGGWCFEHNLLFATVLRTLGYDVMSTGARVNEAVQPMSGEVGWKGPKYSGW